MSDKPVSDLIDQLKLMRVELGDLKKRQVSEERLTHLQAAMEDTASKIESVRESAAIGALEGTKQLRELLDLQFGRTSIKVDGAVNSLSEARREASGTILARRRNVALIALFSVLTGLATGALLSLIVFDYYLGRDFHDSVARIGWNLPCRSHGGFISDQDNGKFCVFQISE